MDRVRESVHSAPSIPPKPDHVSSVNPLGLPTGKISGLVVDQDGKGISGATVAVFDQDTKSLKLTTQSGTDGSFSMSDLPLGTYSVTFKMTNFQTSTVRDISLTADHPRELTVTLKVLLPKP
jgi:hypothetical protein